MTDWREWRASLGSGTGETLDSLKPSQAAADQQVTDSGGLSAPIAAGGAEAPGISPVKSLSSLFRVLNAAIAPLKAGSCFCFPPAHLLAARRLYVLLCTRGNHPHFSYIIVFFFNVTTPPPPNRAGLVGSVQGDLQLSNPSFV